MSKQVVQLDRVIIRFAGDSGDGMQLTGDRFTSSTAMFGNDLSTLPDFPAEIRAPAGTLPGVSAFQLHFADHDIMTPGDAPNVLVAMNPAALKVNLTDNAIRVVRTIEEDVEEELPYGNVSDTIKRYLFLYTIIKSHKGFTLLLDEPEQNSFPFYVKHTGEMLGLDKDNQYFITTHNAYLFRSIVEKTPKKELSVFITSNDEAGHTQLKRLSSTELAKLLDMDVFFNLDQFAKA